MTEDDVEARSELAGYLGRLWPATREELLARRDRQRGARRRRRAPAHAADGPAVREPPGGLGAAAGGHVEGHRFYALSGGPSAPVRCRRSVRALDLPLHSAGSVHGGRAEQTVARALGRQLAGRTTVVQRLEEHPNLAEVLGVLAQLAHISDDDLPRLAEALGQQPVASPQARDRALSPDSPLVVEVLAAFDARERAVRRRPASARPPTSPSTPRVTTTALKAVRDAIAAVYARPVLSRSRVRRAAAPVARGLPDADRRRARPRPAGRRGQGAARRAAAAGRAAATTRRAGAVRRARRPVLRRRGRPRRRRRLGLPGRRADQPPPGLGARPPHRHRGPVAPVRRPAGHRRTADDDRETAARAGAVPRRRLRAARRRRRCPTPAPACSPTRCSTLIPAQRRPDRSS